MVKLEDKSKDSLLLLFGHKVMSDSLLPHGLQHARFPVLHYLLEFAQTHVHWVGDAVHPSYPLSPPSSPVFSLSQHQGLFQSVNFSHLWPKYWSFSFSISPSNEYSRLISCRTDWFDLLAVQGTLQSILQHHNSKASVLQFSTSFMVQLSHPCMTFRKTIAFIVWNFVGKLMSLLFNMLSRFVIAFLPRSMGMCGH